MPGRAESVQLVADGKERMAQQHPRAGVSHDFFGLGPLRRLVTVNGAVGAGRLVLAVRTFQQPHFGIVQKLPALGAQDVPGAVMVSGAIDSDHFGHG